MEFTEIKNMNATKNSEELRNYSRTEQKTQTIGTG